MPWLFLLLAIAALAIAFMTASMTVVVLSLVAALVLLGLWILGLLSQRIDTRSRDDAQMLDPRELQRLRELAEARRAEPAVAPGPTAMDEPRAP
ncbi:hypothetical protein QFW80_09420 [Luteimonas sp. M1R5S18]|jgi:hypothetical protein|uniref:Uncharacterized protein n=1 Tax=Luteimonas rhizosphaericola TaxID=3042024 RepID=A0ABT6JJW7_9GAMM|nr:hypothetical protein [Luteimonas rhizosphaericola]MDH5830728.1 hypothetical protein [Luteimonas rhizosphaericola]